MERRDSIVIKVSSNINDEYSAPHSTFEHRIVALQVEKARYIQFKVNHSCSSQKRFAGFWWNFFLENYMGQSIQEWTK